MQYHSWEQLIKNEIVKNLDFSSFNHNETGIPQGIYSFFNLENNPKEEIPLTLVANNIQFSASIKWSPSKSKASRRRMHWHSKFSNYLKQEFPNWRDINQFDQSVEMKLVFGKTSKPNVFNISLISSTLNKKKYWWVNQNQTLKQEISGGYMWSPKTKNDGTQNPFYNYMKEVEIGDVIFSFANTYISYIGIATAGVFSSSKPSEFDDDNIWSNDGWLVPVEYHKLSKPFRPKNHIKSIKPFLPNKYSPLQKNGNGNQGVYLTEISPELASQLLDLLEGQVDQIIDLHYQDDADWKKEEAETQTIQNINQRDIPNTEKEQLIKSRIGHGRYRRNLQKIESRCRFTGLTDTKYLIHSHIKPWAESDDFEKLDGNNGLLLSPHIDKLFDGGYISFSDDGYILTSTRLNTDVLSLWHIDNLINIGAINTSIHIGKFNNKQKEYLHFHRMHVYKASDPITNAELQIKDLPNASDLNMIEEFCLTFDGYAHCSIVSCDANIPLVQKEVKLKSRKYLSDLRLELFYAHPHFQSVRGDENPEDTLFDLYNELYPIFVEIINNKTSKKKKV